MMAWALAVSLTACGAMQFSDDGEAVEGPWDHTGGYILTPNNFYRLALL